MKTGSRLRPPLQSYDIEDHAQVKRWAKGAGVTGAPDGRLSSYALTLMAIYYAQRRGALPVLQGSHVPAAFLEPPDVKQRCNIAFGLPAGWHPNADAELCFAGFVRFYATEYGWGDECVSVRTGSRLGRGCYQELLAVPPRKGIGAEEWKLSIRIEDPFEKARDLADVLLSGRSTELREALCREHASRTEAWSSTKTPQRNEKERLGVVSLGQRIFPMIASLEPARAGKITGMILEMTTGMNDADVLELVESPDRSKAVVCEAWRVLLAAASEEERNQLLGGKIFPMIARLEPAHAGKITGMILQMDDADVLELVESPDRLKAVVWEAWRILLEAASKSLRDQMLGEKIFRMLPRLEPGRAAKITGMILQMNDADVLELVESPDRLQAVLCEAGRMLLAAASNRKTPKSLVGICKPKSLLLERDQMLGEKLFPIIFGKILSSSLRG